MSIKDTAQEISKLIQSVDTDNRGFLLSLVSSDLKDNMQYFTGKVIECSAEMYGLPEVESDGE